MGGDLLVRKERFIVHEWDRGTYLCGVCAGRSWACTIYYLDEEEIRRDYRCFNHDPGSHYMEAEG